MAELKTVKVSDIHPNPRRNFGKYPIKDAKVELLKASFERTGFWDGYMYVRPAPDGNGYQQAFGHHRVAAARELGLSTLRVMVADLTDDQMLQMMAHENSEHFKTMFYWAVMEPIEAVVRAYAEGKVELERPDPKAPKTTLRFAPSHVPGSGCEHPYSAATVARYLGWTERQAQAAERVLTALAALELIEKGVLRREQFYDLSTIQAGELVRITRATEKAKIEAADAEVEVRERARALAEEQGDKIRAKREADAIAGVKEKAAEHARAAAVAIGKTLSSAFTQPETTSTRAAVEAVAPEFIRTRVEKQTKELKGRFEEAATPEDREKVEGRLDKLLGEEEREWILKGVRDSAGTRKLKIAAEQASKRLRLLVKGLEGKGVK